MRDADEEGRVPEKGVIRTRTRGTRTALLLAGIALLIVVAAILYSFLS